MYLPYEPISLKPDSSSFVPPELLEAQKQGKKLIKKSTLKEWDEWVARKIGLEKEKMWEIFSSEQIDSIGLTIYNFENGKGFIIADETGIGKGRILSGICRWAITHNKKIMFFTEREHLFSDFWRDLTDTNTLELLSNPIIFHSTSKVYNPEGELVLKSNVKDVKEYQKNGFPENSNLVMTNYSQISLKEHKNTKKDSMLNYCEDNLIILDESHNASGDSNTKKFLLNLTESTKNIVFSSATFIKDESQLDIYEQVIDFDSETLKLLKRLLINDKERLLRKIFTYELTRNLQFWRREHQPLEIGWKSIICENDELQIEYINKYSEIINKLFNLVNSFSKEPSLESLNLTNSWFSLGATINRLSRNLLLLFKTDTLVEAVLNNSLKRDHKAVIVIDSTFSSIINKVIENQVLQENLKYSQKDIIEEELDDEENTNEEIILSKDDINYKLNFQEILLYIIEEVAGKIIREYETVINQHLISEYYLLKEQTIFFKNLDISPIDKITHKLAEVGIKCNEISGRNSKVNTEGKIEKIIKKPKSKLIKEFNDGEVDVIIITRAGASGTSLHASATFKDQRVRDLYELEITNRPTYRLQFIGRVNRKNQVVQPEFFTIVTRLPFEQRILNVEQQKLKTLQSHISGDDEKLDQENIYNFYTDYCNECAYIFLKNHPFLAFQMGISLRSKKEDLYYIDSILKRCIVLNAEQQNFLYNYLIYCTECENKLRINKSLPEQIKYSAIKTYWHQLDKIQQKEFTNTFQKFPQYSINQFKFPWVGVMKTTSTYSTKLVFSASLKKELTSNYKHYDSQQKYLKSVLNAYYVNQNINQEYVRDTIAPTINNLALGKTITIKTMEGSIFGYIHNITYPEISKTYLYDHLCLIHIKTINPHLHESIFYSPEDFYITLKDLLSSENISIQNKQIDWKKYERPTKKFERINYCWVGHPIYMEFLRQSYDIGKVKYFEVGGRKNMCILLPSGLSIEKIFSLKKPIFSTNKIMELLISKEIKKLSTSWEESDYIKPSLKIEQTSGGYNLFIASEISRDSKVIDYPLKKKLKNIKGRRDGFDIFFIPYKEMRMILFMLEKREVIWFIN